MTRYRKQQFEKDQQQHPDFSYGEAFKRMKRIKGFYMHLLIYLVFNTIIIGVNQNQKWSSKSDFWQWETFSTALFWGIGLAAHGLSVYGRQVFFAKQWEERKIQQLMEKDKKSQWE
ncbi:MAG: 2TM domain-containing protein [Burkholderiales bacterium]|nr:2TM domain-containing protein [Flavobacterium sp.]